MLTDLDDLAAVAISTLILALNMARRRLDVKGPWTRAFRAHGGTFDVTRATGCATILVAMAPDPIGDIGRRIPGASAALRPDALVELRAWRGQRLVRGKRVLDIGCGDGRFAIGLAPLASTVSGIDPDPESIGAARRNARRSKTRNVRFTVGAAQELSYRAASFDVVILSWSL